MEVNKMIECNGILTGRIRLPNPTKQTVNWNPNEYKVKSIDLENGEIIFAAINAE